MNKLEVPNIEPWLAGDIPVQDMMNQIQDAFEFLMDPPQVHVARSATSTLAVTNVTETLVPFDKKFVDNCANLGSPMWSANEPTKIVCRVPGWYDFKLITVWESTTDNKRRTHWLRRNGGVIHFGRHDSQHVAELNNNYSEDTFWWEIGDYLELVVWHDKGSTTNLLNQNTDPGAKYGQWTSLKAKWVSL